MTREESAIVSAFTGVLAGPFDALHEYVEKIMGRPVFTHELGSAQICAEIKEKSRNDFLAMAASVSNTPEKNKIKADAVMGFVGTLIGAYETGFVDSPITSIGTIYQVARNHVKDSFGVDTKPLAEEVGEDFAKECRTNKTIAALDELCANAEPVCDSLEMGQTLKSPETLLNFRKALNAAWAILPEKKP